jgi:hypothetical protein
MVKRVWREGAVPVHWSVILTVILLILLMATAAWRFLYVPEDKAETMVVTDAQQQTDAEGFLKENILADEDVEG